MRVHRLVSQTTVHPLPKDRPAPFVIECLSPTGEQAERYEDAILDCIGPDNRIAKELPRSAHNDISVVLEITSGETVVILGGDLEKGGWKAVIGDYGAANLDATAVKISHHGSENGYCEGLWNHFALTGKPIAVIAPRHQDKLPTPTALSHISKNAKTILATCQPHVDRQTPRPTKQAGPPLESRTALRGQLAAIQVPNDAACGRCSLLFDDKGSFQVELIPLALSLISQER